MSGFATALPVVLGVEGGFSDHPNDRGGATNFGVTESVYHDWLRSMGRPIRPVRDITLEEAEQLYHRDYWVEAKCDALPWPVSLVVFDSAVNHGVGRARRLLQEALCVKVDGIIGPVTLAAAAGADARWLVNDILWLRVGLYRELAADRTQLGFLRGWLARLVHLREEVGLA